MFKKTMKTLTLVAATYTIAEFVTMWRVQTTPETLKQFTKSYFSIQKGEFARSYKAGQLLWEDPEAGKAIIKDQMFPFQQ
jgi:hypothetical protein